MALFPPDVSEILDALGAGDGGGRGRRTVGGDARFGRRAGVASPPAAPAWSPASMCTAGSPREEGRHCRDDGEPVDWRSCNHATIRSSGSPSQRP